MIKVNSECPICGTVEAREYSVAQLHLMSWAKFPVPLDRLETGTVRNPCGGVECRKEISMRVGIRFECWNPGSRR
jgi:hypothetical protein